MAVKFTAFKSKTATEEIGLNAGGQVSRFAFCASLFEAPTMVSPLRIEYAGAAYHVTSRGERREPVAKEDVDRSR